jgi:hypothetical protein
MEFLPVGAPLDSDIQQFCSLANEVYTNYSKIWGPWDPGRAYHPITQTFKHTKIIPLSIIQKLTLNRHLMLSGSWQWEAKFKIGTTPSRQDGFMKWQLS